MRSWQLQEAKNKFSEVVSEAITDGPQIITRRGIEVAVLLSYDQFKALRSEQLSLVDFFQTVPIASEDLDLQRDISEIRPPIEL
ncbi:type II toxin-antitoxin system prevent-host-death family antitoxin [bacterium]|nr:type II toxin-antitoxin system prevent-host-death family antitoxin [bacterium]